MLVASSSVKPRLGMIVPGLTAGGFKIQRFRSSGPLFGTAPPAMGLRDATPARFGPMVPLAPGIPGMVWQPGQPFCGISMAPMAGSPPPGAGWGGLAGAGAPGAGAGDGPGTCDRLPGVTAGLGTTGAGGGDAAGFGTGAAGAALPVCCCCNHVWNSFGATLVTRNSMPLCPAPQSIAHTPRNSPGCLAVNVMWLIRPGF